MDEHAEKDLEKLMEEQQKSELRKQIIHAIKNKKEFNYLEKLCKVNGVVYNIKIIDYCLDRYIHHRKEGSKQFISKYAAMFTTCWAIMYQR